MLEVLLTIAIWSNPVAKPGLKLRIERSVKMLLPNEVLFYGSAILLGIILSIVLERVTVFVHKKKEEKEKTNSTTNTISESHIKECICLDSDKGKQIDNAVENLKDANIYPPFSLEF